MVKKTHAKYYLAGFVSLLAFAVYLPALTNAFVEWDDSLYIYENFFIRSLDAAFIKWAFSTFRASNWHPLTWISHAVDYALWGLNPLGHHLTNNILHAANTFIVLLLAIRVLEVVKEKAKAKGNENFPDDRRILIAAGVTALLFGLHPAHVESVAWVAERKDLLCAFFFLLSVMSYMKYAANASQGAKGIWTRSKIYFAFTQRDMLFALCFFILALLSKPMAVSLPVVLLILDWYPLERVRSLKSFWSAALEKFPFIVLSLGSSVVTILAQKAGGAMKMMDYVPLSKRLLVAARSLFLYIWKMAFPLDLNPYYPYPAGISPLSADFFVPVMLAAGITALCIKKGKIWQAIWGYYAVTLLPVLGLVQVGGQSMADRYTYIPSLGPFLFLGLGAAWISKKMEMRKGRLTVLHFSAAALIMIVSMTYLTINQIRIWKNGIVLWNFVIEKQAERVPLAYNNRGLALSDGGNYDEALKDFNKAIELDPLFYEAYANRGTVFEKTGRFNEALADFEKSISLNPYYKIYFARAIVFEKQGLFEKARLDYHRAVAMNPAFFEGFVRLGIIYGRLGSFEKAIENFNEAIKINPNYPWAYGNRGFAFFLTGHYEAALEDLNTAIRLNSRFTEAYTNRGKVYLKTGNNRLAAADFKTACDYGDKEGCRALQSVTRQ